MLLETLGFGVVGIEASDCGRWETAARLPATMALVPAVLYITSTVIAVGAAGRRRGVVAAAMAAQLVMVAVIGQRHVAVRAGGLPAAVLAHHHAGRAAAV